MISVSLNSLGVSGHGLIWWHHSVGMFDLDVLLCTAFGIHLSPSRPHSGQQEMERRGQDWDLYVSLWFTPATGLQLAVRKHRKWSLYWVAMCPAKISITTVEKQEDIVETINWIGLPCKSLFVFSDRFTLECNGGIIMNPYCGGGGSV